MDQYFFALGIDSEESRLNRATMFLTDAAKVWWRTKYHEIQAGRCNISTWEELKQELKVHFYPENVDYLARRKLRDLMQKGSVQDYVKQFTTIMLDIWDMTKRTSYSTSWMVYHGMRLQNSREEEFKPYPTR